MVMMVVTAAPVGSDKVIFSQFARRRGFAAAVTGMVMMLLSSARGLKNKVGNFIMDGFFVLGYRSPFSSAAHIFFDIGMILLNRFIGLAHNSMFLL